MENEVKNSFRTGYTKGLGFGVILILLGSVFLGLRTGMIPERLENVIISWPMLLILIGVGNLFKRHWISGIILILVGKFFLVPRIIEAYPTVFPGLNADFTHIYWPLLFIMAGILIIAQRIFYPQWGIGTLENRWYHRRYCYGKGYLSRIGKRGSCQYYKDQCCFIFFGIERPNR